MNFQKKSEAIIINSFSHYNTLDIANLVKQLLDEKVLVHLRVFGPSMRPGLLDGDDVMIRPVASNEPRWGQVTLFRQHGRLSLHRCVGGRGEGACHFAADAGLRGRETARREDVLGIATTRSRGENVRRLDTRGARGIGLLGYYARPLRRLALRLRNSIRGA